MIGGWASNNKYSLLGALRASSQMISYEIAMGLSIIALVMMTGTLSVREIAEQQPGGHWNVFYQPLASSFSWSAHSQKPTVLHSIFLNARRN
jgi:NADH-quinone oxidoreductase subunit H